MKITIVILAICLLLVSPFQAAASDGNGAEFPQLPALGMSMSQARDIETNENVVNNVYSDADLDMHFLQVGKNAETLNLPTNAFGRYDWMFVVECEVVWRYDEFNSETPGRKLLKGDVLLPENYSFEGTVDSIEVAIIVYDESGAPQINLRACSYESTVTGVPILIPQGANKKEIEEIFEEKIDETGLIACMTEDGDSFFCSYTLDLSVIDTSKLGAYFPFQIDLPPGISVAGQEQWATTAYVMPVDKVSLSAFSATTYQYVLQWIYSPENPVMWMAVDKGDWQVLDDAFSWRVSLSEDGSSTINGYDLNFSLFTSNSTYRFGVQDGDFFSDILLLDFTNGTIPKATYEIGGDRNGGDREEAKPPEELGGETEPEKNPESGESESENALSEKEIEGEIVTSIPPKENALQPSEGNKVSSEGSHSAQGSNAPDTAKTLYVHSVKKHTEEPVVVENNQGASNNGLEFAGEIQSLLEIQELVETTEQPADAVINDPTKALSGKSIILLGKQLKQLMESNPDYITLFQGVFRLSLPTGYFSTLNISDSSVVVVTMYQPDTSSFVIDLTIDNTLLRYSYAEPFLVNIPWSGNGVVCVEEGGFTTEGVADSRTETVDFWLLQTGHYVLVENLEINITPVAQEFNTNENIASAVAKTQPQMGFHNIFIVAVTALVAIAIVFISFAHKRRK